MRLVLRVMAAWSIALHIHRGRQDVLRRKLLGTRQIDGMASLLPLGNEAAASCSSLATKPARPSQELLWRQFFLDHTLWWDNRQKKTTTHLPDFRHKESHEVLWLNNFYKPAWVDAQLAALDMHMGRRAKSSLSDAHGSSTAETVNKLCQLGQVREAVEALGVLVQTHSRISKSLSYAVLKKCVAKKDLVLGRHVHALIVSMGYESDTFLCNHILRMYASHARLQEAMDVFTGVAKPDAFTWSSIISAHVAHGQAKQAIQLYHQMRSSSVDPDGHVFVAALQACASGADLITGQLVHADVVASGVVPDLFVCSCLVDMYAKCGSLEDAQRVFDGTSRKNVVTWNAMIAGYAQQGKYQEASTLYNRMLLDGISAPNSVTFVCLLQACASVGIPAMEKGKQLHAHIEERGLQADVVLGCSLVNMYVKCGCLEDAQSVFDELPKKDVVTWTTMIAGYSQLGMGQKALRLYSDMELEGISAPDSVTFVCLLQACASVGITALETGKELHAQIDGRGLQADVVVVNSLINMYSKCGCLEHAQRMFDGLRKKDVVTWNAMIAGYAQEGMGHEAFDLYKRMQTKGMSTPDSVTFVSLLQACASVGIMAIDMGKQLHGEIEEQGLEADVFVANRLINMYAKCGCFEDAQSLFDRLREKDIVTWNVMIAGYAQQGMGQEAFSLYSRMQQESISGPNSVTFVCLLQACASLGIMAIEKGKLLHAQIEGQRLQADGVLGCSLVNMYAKCCSLGDAQSVFDRLREKDVVTWNSMIAGYVQQDMGQEAFSLYNMMQQEGKALPDSVTYVYLLQACASVAGLLLGRQLHAQIEEQGLQADLSVSKSLIYMYAKSGSMVDAQQVFDALPQRDDVAWNALIAGYTRQGDSEVVFELVNRMTTEDHIQPTSITALSLLTVCSHAGLVNKGRDYFEAMSRHYGITPTVEHYTCMVDLLGRAGQLDEALGVVRTMPVEPHGAIWRSLLGACQKWSNFHVGKHAFDEAVRLDEKDAAAYVLMSNIYKGAQMWEEAEEMHARRRRIGVRKQPGQSWWTDMGGTVHAFVAGDDKYP